VLLLLLIIFFGPYPYEVAKKIVLLKKINIFCPNYIKRTRYEIKFTPLTKNNRQGSLAGQFIKISRNANH